MNDTGRGICALEHCQRFAWDTNYPAYCILHSHYPDKDQDLFQQTIEEVVSYAVEHGTPCDFTNVHFPRDYDYHRLTEALEHDCCFKEAVFQRHDHINFDNLRVQGNVDFSEATFNGKTSFENTIFEDDVCLYNAKFESLTNFFNSEFHGKANFSAANIASSTFRQATFFRRPHFGVTTFCNDVSFHRTIFREGSNFYKARFLAHADFRRAEFHGYTSFVEAIFESATFSRAYMSFCRLLMVDLNNIDFTGSIWPEKRYRRFLPSRKTVYDEDDCILSKEPYDIDHIIKLYRKLCENQENIKEYELAGDFHYGAQELERKKLGGWPPGEASQYPLPVHNGWRWIRRNVLSLRAWYHHLSGYGERPGQTLTIWVVLLLAATLGVMYAGFPASGSDDLIQYHWTWRLSDLNWKLAEDSLSAFLYVLRASTFRLQLQNVGLATTGIVTFASIFGPLQLALFVLALRRRFKR